ncbi:hypothetical protein MRX96_047396 [Rhipicephalus microplus]
MLDLRDLCELRELHSSDVAEDDDGGDTGVSHGRRSDGGNEARFPESGGVGGRDVAGDSGEGVADEHGVRGEVNGTFVAEYALGKLRGVGNRDDTGAGGTVTLRDVTDIEDSDGTSEPRNDVGDAEAGGIGKSLRRR